MENNNANPFSRKILTEDVLKEWQNLLDEGAQILGVPAGLITRVDEKEIEILLSSKTEGNPYPADFTSKYPDSGWYCEYTLKSRGLNLIPNAFKDPEWKDNSAAVGLHIISYVGMPIERPDGGQFGTVCFLDNKENPHNDLHIKLVKQISDLRADQQAGRIKMRLAIRKQLTPEQRTQVILSEGRLGRGHRGHGEGPDCAGPGEDCRRHGRGAPRAGREIN